MIFCLGISAAEVCKADCGSFQY